jgi:hypothetical protein
MDMSSFRTKRTSLTQWLQHREAGETPPVGSGNNISHMLYGSMEVQHIWNPRKMDEQHYGSIFNFDFATDGYVYVV